MIIFFSFLSRTKQTKIISFPKAPITRDMAPPTTATTSPPLLFVLLLLASVVLQAEAKEKEEEQGATYFLCVQKIQGQQQV